MLRRAVLAGAVALLLTSGAPMVAALEPFETAPDSRLQLEWETASRRGAPIVRGYVINTNGYQAANVLLMVERVDANGAVIGKQIGWASSMVPNFGRAYFELKVAPAAEYRVRILSWDWWKGGGQ